MGLDVNQPMYAINAIKIITGQKYCELHLELIMHVLDNIDNDDSLLQEQHRIPTRLDEHGSVNVQFSFF